MARRVITLPSTILLFLALVASDGWPLSLQLNRVADLSTPIPGGSGNFTSLDISANLSGSNVALQGFGSSGQQGIYFFDGSVLRRVADLDTAIPGGGGDFTSLAFPMLSGGNVALGGVGSSGQEGIYLFDGDALSRVADLNTAVPAGSGNFTSLLFPTPGGGSSLPLPALSGRNVAFLGFGSSGQEGIYLFDGGVLSRVADLNTAIPGGSGSFTSFAPPDLPVIPGGNTPAVSGSNVVFHAIGSSGQEGIYLFEAGVLTRVADLNTAVPAGSGNFTILGPSALSGRNVVFLGHGSSGQQGIYLFDGSVLSRVADLNTAIPGGSGNFSALGS